MQRLLATVVLLVLLLAGCSGGGKDADAKDGTADGAGSSGLGTTTGTSRPGLDANLTQKPPSWSVGQAWSWRITAASMVEPIEAVTTVLAADGSTYDIGAATVADGAWLHPFHLVALGAVDASCLCWTAHGSPVPLLRFPLKDNLTYTADFWAAPGATVRLQATTIAAPSGPEPGFRSTVTDASGATFLQADYSPRLGQFVRVARYMGGDEPYTQAELLAAKGTPSAPVGFRATDLARITASATDPASLAPQAFTVPAGTETLLLACFIPADDGAYGAQVTVAGTPLACATPGTTRPVFLHGYGDVQAGPGDVVPFAAGESASHIEVFAVDTTPP